MKVVFNLLNTFMAEVDNFAIVIKCFQFDFSRIEDEYQIQ